MAEDYAIKLLKISLAQISQNVGFHSGTNVSMSVLVDIYRRYMENMCKTLRRHCDHYGRNEPTLDDMEMMFNDLRVSVRELSDYVNQVAPIPFKHKIPVFPVALPSKLRIPPADSEELRTRPDYIPSHLPLLKPEMAPSTSIQQQNLEMTNGDTVAGKVTDARLSNQRLTVSHGKHDLSQYSDLIPDFSDFDAMKAGLVKFVHVATPFQSQPTSSSYVGPPILSAAIPAPTSSASTSVSKSSTAPHMIKVAEEKSTKKKPVVLDVRPHLPKTTSPIFPHPKLKITLPSFSKKKRVMPIIVKRKETKELKIHPPALDVDVKKKKANSENITIHVPVREESSFVDLGKEEMDKAPEIEKMVDDSTTENTMADALATGNLDTSTAESSVEDLVTSVVEETHEKMKAQQKAFEASVNFVVNDLEDEKSLADRPILEQEVTKSMEEPVASIPHAEPHPQIPSTSTAIDVDETSKGEKLKSILDRSRKILNKEIIQQRIKSKAARKEAEEKKIQDVVEKSFQPIAKREDTVTVPPAVIVPATTLVIVSTQSPVVTTTTTISTSTTETSKAPRRPPGIPPTTPRLKKEKSTHQPSVVGRPPIPKLDLGKVKKVEPLPPLFQPEHIKKSAPTQVDSRKVAPVVISKSKLPSQLPSPPKPTSIAASNSESKRTEQPKLILKLPQMKPSTAPKEEHKRKHGHEKERKKERHKEKEGESHHVSKEKKEKKEKHRDEERIVSKITEPASTAPSASCPIKLKINLGKPKATLDSIGKDTKMKGGKLKSESLHGRPPSVATSSIVSYDSPQISPPTRLSSPKRIEPIMDTHLGGDESPPPRTPSPGNSRPSTPSDIDFQAVDRKREIERDTVVEPPAKKQRPDQWSAPSSSAPASVKVSTSKPGPTRVQEAQPTKNHDDAWYCPVCNVPYEEGADMIACDACDRWFHWVCVGLLQAPPSDENWYCRECQIAKSSKHGFEKRKQKTSMIKKKFK